ncbi:MAG: PpiC-type peptidyl-prolyl cis-trans isomerase, partial [Bacteroidetes bacterium]|nr:PpiC-type peptidyl-prolyl cis-trans isomerase [Bacteroidota bacterium]
MALMTQIRENLTTLFAVLAVFFIILIVFDWGMDYTGTSGRGAASKEFSDRVRREVEGLRQRDANNEIGEETERQLRSQVWSAIVDETLLEQEIERLGITVTDQEIIDVVKGPNPPEFLTARFRDSSGTFHREDFLQAIAAPENKKAMVEVENIVRQQVKRQKL